MTLGDRIDPYMVFNFLVEIDGLVVGGFSEVNGLQIEVEVHDYREGGQNDYVHRLPGPVKYPSNLILKHGMTDRKELWKWHQQVTKGIILRRNVSILLQPGVGTGKGSIFQKIAGRIAGQAGLSSIMGLFGESSGWRWDFQEAFPIRWEGPQLRATTDEVAIETIEFVHRGLIDMGSYW